MTICKNCEHRIRENKKIGNVFYHVNMDIKNKCYACGCINPEPKEMQNEFERMAQRNMLFGQCQNE